LTKKLVYIHEEEREIPGYGVYKTGDVVDYDETLIATGLFEVKEKKKEGDK
jgi:hypothetical protein